MSQRRVVVTGVGLVTPLGIGRDRVWNKLLQGEHGIQKLTDEYFKGLQSRVAGLIPGDELEKFGELSHLRFVRLAIVAASQAIEDASITLNESIGVSIGSGMSCVAEVAKEARTMDARGPRRVSPHFVPRILGNMAAGHICIRWGLRGPVFAPSTACATGASAIGEAFRAIRYGDADVMLAGATESCIDPLSMAGFCQARALTTRFNEDPGLSSRPFDKNRSGFVIGEGAAVLILEELGHAKARGANLIGEIIGYGTSADAHHITASHPDGLGARLAMSRALKEAGISPAEVGYIKAHGTSTPLGDRAELLAIKALFGEQNIIVSSTKGATGHLLSAAGAVESAFALLALQSETIPPNRNFSEHDDELRPLLKRITIPTTAIQSRPEYALSNSFGFGGMNVSLCFGKID